MCLKSVYKLFTRATVLNLDTYVNHPFKNKFASFFV